MERRRAGTGAAAHAASVARRRCSAVSDGLTGWGGGATPVWREGMVGAVRGPPTEAHTAMGGLEPSARAGAAPASLYDSMAIPSGVVTEERGGAGGGGGGGGGEEEPSSPWRCNLPAEVEGGAELGPTQPSGSCNSLYNDICSLWRAAREDIGGPIKPWAGASRAVHKASTRGSGGAPAGPKSFSDTVEPKREGRQ